MRYLTLGVLLAVLVGLFPIPAAAQPTILTVTVPEWSDLPEEAFAAFEAAQGVDVVLVQPDAMRMYFGLEASEETLISAEGYVNSADVLLIDGYSLNPITTRAGYVLDMNPLISADTTFDPNIYYPAAYQSFQWESGLWALPISIGLNMFIYDTEKFDAAGLPYPGENTTLNDLETIARTLSEFDAEGDMTIPAFSTYNRADVLRALWGQPIYDPNDPANPLRLDNPDLAALLEQWAALEAEGVFIQPWTLDTPIPEDQIALTTGQSFTLRFNPDNLPRVGAPLPNNATLGSVQGLAISAGTQQPELAYELIKYMTTSPEIAYAFFGDSPAVRNLEQQEESFFVEASPELQAQIDEILLNALPLRDTLFSLALDDALFQMQPEGENAPVDAVTALEQTAAKLTASLAAAEARRGVATLAVVPPNLPPPLAEGEITLDFNVSSLVMPMPNRDRWDQVVADFVAADPEVGFINFDNGFATSPVEYSSQYDCFAMPFHDQSFGADTVLSLDPFLDTDSSFDRNDLFPGVLAQVQQDNVTFGLPLALQPNILWVDTAQFEAAGLPIPGNTWTVGDFENALRTLLSASAEGEAPFGTDYDWSNNYLLMLIAAYGGVPMDYSTTPETFNLTAPETVEAIRQVLNLVKDGLINFRELDSTSGTVGGFSFERPIRTGALSLGDFQATGQNEANPAQIVAYPRGSQYTPVSYTISTAYISNQSDAPEACYRWLSHLRQHPELFSAMPAYPSLLADEAVIASLPAATLAFYESFAEALQSPTMLTIPDANSSSTRGRYIYDLFLNRAMNRYVLEDADLEAELAEAQRLALEYQTCAANIPAFDALTVDTIEEQMDYYNQFAECAVAVDPTLADRFSFLNDEE